MAARRLGFAFGVAALALLPGWDAVGALPPHARSAAALGWMAAGTLAIVAAVEGVERLPGRARVAGRVLLGLLLAWLLAEAALHAVDAVRNGLVALAGPRYRVARNALAAVALLALAAWAGQATRRGARSALALGAGAVSLAAPLPLIVAAGWLIGPGAPAAADAAPAARRFVVLVFDELDATMLAQAPQPLPHFAEVAAGALAATRMYPPANYTSESLPGMLSGEDYEATTYTPRDVRVQPAGDARWPSLASRPTWLAPASGARAAVVGWHLPYCATFRTLADCWDDAAWRAPGAQVGLPEWIVGTSALARALSQRELDAHRHDIPAFSRLFFATPDKYRLRRIGAILDAQRERLLAVLRANRSEVVLGHLACPHPPAQDAAGRRDDIFAAYRRNLAACDALLGEVLAELRRTGSPWQLVVTSDHWFRGRDWVDLGVPQQAPRERRTVPFHLWIDGLPGTAASTDAISSSRVLTRLAAAALRGELDYARAKALIEAEGDRPTRLRPF